MMLTEAQSAATGHAATGHVHAMDADLSDWLQDCTDADTRQKVWSNCITCKS